MRTCNPASLVWALQKSGRAVALLFLVLVSPAAGAGKKVASSANRNSIVDRYHGQLSKSIVGTACWFDAFFGDQRMEVEEKGPRLRLRPSVEFSEGENPALKLGANLKMPLPNLEDRLQLVFDTLLLEEDDADEEEHIDGGVGEATQSYDVSAATRVHVAETKASRIDFDAGIKLHSSDIEPFVKLRVRNLNDTGACGVRFTQRVFWSGDEGVGETSRVDLDWKARADTLFRATSAVTWSEVTQGVDLHQAFSLFRSLDGNRRAAGIILRGMGHTDPADLDTVEVVLKYRRQIFREWLFLDIEPGARFPSERDYESTPYLKLQLDIIFEER